VTPPLPEKQSEALNNLSPQQQEIERRLAQARTKTELTQLKKSVGERTEAAKEFPEIIYQFALSSSTPEKEDKLDEALILLNREYDKANPEKEFNITITGTADKVLFGLDETSSKPRVNLKHSKAWRDKYLEAFKKLQATNTISELIGLDFDKKGIYVIYKLSLDNQQKVMNHALAYMRAERLKTDIASKFNHPNVRFKLQTDWSKKSTRRISSIIDLGYTKKESTPKTPDPTPVTPPNPDKPPKLAEIRRKKRPPKPEPPRPEPPKPEPPKPEPPKPEPPKPEPPKPEPPKPEPPPKPNEVPKIIESLENDKYYMSRTATLEAGWFGREQEMTASVITHSTGTYQTLFAINKSNPKNPSHYIVYDPSDPYEVSIGKMKYTSYGYKTTTTEGPIEKVFKLDRTDYRKFQENLQEVLKALP
jgi:hypothetical protein